MFRDIQSRGVIKLSDVLRLRRDYFPGGATTEAEAQALFALNSACPVQDTSWSAFLVETIGSYIVHAVPPQGYVTSSNARWLVGHAAIAGQVERLACLDLVLHVLETARWSPPSLAAFALRQIELAIRTGSGPLRTGATSGRGRVGTNEAAMIRRILAAGNRAGGDAITQAEAEVLLDIHDATLTASNCLEWTELVTKTLAHLVMTASGYAPPSREQALQPETWMDSSLPTSEFLERMMSRGFRHVFNAYGRRTSEEQALARLDHEKMEIITAEAIAPLEPAWLAQRMSRSGHLAATERALLVYLRNEPRPLHPALASLLDTAA